MAQEDDGGSEVDETLEVLRMVFIAHDQAAEVEQPREEPFDLPAAAVTSQAPTVLCTAAVRADWGRSIRCRTPAAVVHPVGRCRRLCPQSAGAARPPRTAPPAWRSPVSPQPAQCFLSAGREEDHGGLQGP